MKISYLLIIDANFGILPRDMEITDKLVELKKKTGFPGFSTYFAAKNNVDRTIEISKKLYEAKILLYHIFDLQHTDKTVLEAMNRKDISLNEKKYIIKSLNEYGVPILIQLILGTPGDTLELWKKAITDIMELGCHEEYKTNIFNVLKGSRACDYDYRKKWEIKTVSRYTSLLRRKKNPDLDFKSKSEYIVQTKTFTRDDWIEMYLYDIMAQTFHNGGITRFLSIYLRLTQRIPYKDFYDSLFDKFCLNYNTFTGRIFRKCKEHLHDFVYAPGDALVIEEVELEDLPNFLYLIKMEEYMLFHFLNNFSRLWEELEKYIKTTYDFVENLDSIIDYQKEIIITPGYDLRKGKEITLKHDWPSYFRKAKKITGNESLEEPGIYHKKARIKDMTCGAHSSYPLDWVYKKDREAMLASFFETVIGIRYLRAERTYFRNIEIPNSTAQKNSGTRQE